MAVYNEYKRTKASWRHIDFYDVDDASGILSSKPISIIHHHQPLSHSSASTGFLDFSRNPNPHFNSSPFSDGLSLSPLFSGDEQQLSNHFSFLNDEDLFASLHNMSYSANDACLDSEKPGFRGGGGGDGYWFPLAGSS